MTSVPSSVKTRLRIQMQKGLVTVKDLLSAGEVRLFQLIMLNTLRFAVSLIFRLTQYIS